MILWDTTFFLFLLRPFWLLEVQQGVELKVKQGAELTVGQGAELVVEERPG